MARSVFLGLGGSSHDFSAAIVEDGRVLVAIEQERLDRKKHGSRRWCDIPCAAAIDYCLKSRSLSEDDVAGVHAPHDHLPSLGSLLGRRLTRVDHHLAHAAASYFSSPFETAGVLVIDGHGGAVAPAHEGLEELQTISFGNAVGTSIHLDTYQTGTKHLTSINWHYIASNSVGSFYKTICDLVGFGLNGMGKMMGLAGYGDESLVGELWELVSCTADGRFTFDPYMGLADWVRDKFRSSENPAQVRANIASAAQHVFETVVLRVVRACHDVTRQRFLVYGGGCAFNTLANSRILNESPFEDLHIYPGAGDAGLSVGAALLGYFSQTGAARQPSDKYLLALQAFTGREYTEAEVIEACEHYPILYRRLDNPVDELVARLLNGEVIGVFRGGSEMGPRALGHRSILSLPNPSTRRRLINLSIKHRESFRPLSPIVPAECAFKFFDFRGESPFMLLVAQVRPQFRRSLGAIVHVDGSARLQTVRKECDPFLHTVLHEIGRYTGLPVLLNTSFNRRDEPIVETPEDALTCFVNQSLDTLLIEDFIAEKHTPWIAPVYQPGPLEQGGNTV